MIQYFPIVTGSLVVLGNVSVSGSINASGSVTISGSIASASYALSASNAATASSADNFLTRGTLTAQTIVVQTITSSIDWVTGSAKFGSVNTDAHTFTGSVSISGSATTALNINAGALFISSSGRVGIGTTNPEQLLHVTNGYIQVGIDKGIRFVSSGASGRPEISIDSNSAFSFKNTAAVTNMLITNGGNVGIGTTNIGTEANLHLGAFSANEGGQLILQRATSYASASHLDNYQNRFRILSGNDTTSAAERFSVDMTNGNTTATGVIIGTGFYSSAGSVSIASGATSNILSLSKNGSYTVGCYVIGGGIIYIAQAIFIANQDNAQYIKAMDIYDGANVTLDISGNNVRITNNGFGTFTWYWSSLYQPFS